MINSNLKSLLIIENKDAVSFMLGSLIRDFKLKGWSIEVKRLSEFVMDGVEKNDFSWSLVEVCPEALKGKDIIDIASKDSLGNVVLVYDSSLFDPSGLVSIKNICKGLNNVYSIMDLSVGKELFQTSIGNLLKNHQYSINGKNSIVDRQSLIKFNQILDTALAETETQAKHVESLYNKFSPKRQEDLKGAKIISKYSAGDGPGGDFFDVVKDQSVVMLFVSSTRSYVLSSLVLSSFTEINLEKKRRKDDLTELVHQVSHKIESVDSEQGFELDLLVARLDLSSLSLSGFNFGKNLLVSSSGNSSSGNSFPIDTGFLEQASFSFSLARGERILILSSGARLALAQKIGEDGVYHYLTSHLNESADAVLNDIFFQLDQNKTGKFLDQDASVIILEVDENALFQV